MEESGWSYPGTDAYLAVGDLIQRGVSGLDTRARPVVPFHCCAVQNRRRHDLTLRRPQVPTSDRKSMYLPVQYLDSASSSTPEQPALPRQRTEHDALSPPPARPRTPGTVRACICGYSCLLSPYSRRFSSLLRLFLSTPSFDLASSSRLFFSPAALLLFPSHRRPSAWSSMSSGPLSEARLFHIPPPAPPLASSSSFTTYQPRRHPPRRPRPCSPLASPLLRPSHRPPVFLVPAASDRHHCPGHRLPVTCRPTHCIFATV